MIRNTTNSLMGLTNGKHDPDSIPWISPSQWNNATWDGVPFNPVGKTNSQQCAWFRPTGSAYIVKGLREKFYQVNPFQDNANPTVKEIEDWNLEVIRHFRALMGDTTPVRHNPRLYLEARWSQERKRTQVWDITYPGPPTGTSDGPCFTSGGVATDTTGGHCGDSFFPSQADRNQYITATPYNGDTTTYPDLMNYTTRHSQTTGNISVNHFIPWSIKLATIISQFICSEGVGGHAAPFLGGRTEFGCHWWYIGNGITAPAVDDFKGKWR
ncbi:MAG: hypothetical protein ACRCZI_07565 [Cetobacterium sp.]